MDSILLECLRHGRRCYSHQIDWCSVPRQLCLSVLAVVVVDPTKKDMAHL